MVWDLRTALLKKQEVETARLAEFEFRSRARTMRLLAAELVIDADALVALIAEKGDPAIIADLAERTGLSTTEVAAAHARAKASAHRQLIHELGDPSPHLLA